MTHAEMESLTAATKPVRRLNLILSVKRIPYFLCLWLLLLFHLHKNSSDTKTTTVFPVFRRVIQLFVLCFAVLISSQYDERSHIDELFFFFFVSD